MMVSDKTFNWDDISNSQIRKVLLQADDTSLGAVAVSEVSPAIMQTLEVTMHDAITSTATSSAVNILNYNKFTVQSVATTSATVEIQVSLDGSNWEVIDTLTDDDISDPATCQGKFKYVRTNVTAVSGALSVYLVAGN